MEEGRALFVILLNIPGKEEYPTDRYHMTFSDVWAYLNFLERYGLRWDEEEGQYFLKDVDFMFSVLNDDNNPFREQIHITLEKK